MISVVLAALGLLPASRMKNRLLSWCGRDWSVASSARIHPVVLWGVRRLVVADRVVVGPANVFRDLERVELAAEAAVGQLNWFTAEARYAAQDDPDRAGTLVLGRGAAIASRHYVDCAGGVALAPLSILAGVRSTILTHWADHRDWRLRAAPVRIGEATIVSSGVTVTAGATIADGCVVAAGAVVPKALREPARLYAGVPARSAADLAGSAHARRTTPHLPRETPVYDATRASRS